ncbi:MAG: hypothetical protein PVI06_17285 [Desulfobacterales bacterium]
MRFRGFPLAGSVKVALVGKLIPFIQNKQILDARYSILDVCPLMWSMQPERCHRSQNTSGLQTLLLQLTAGLGSKKSRGELLEVWGSLRYVDQPPGLHCKSIFT